ncbi:MAG TPA: helix-turn-helix domain-containing protein [Myxococcota bacterium]|nr:helix-turn-helix domain-containing protein [Myxococcota bacterium]HRY96665.1 helix-turn-helix domain-containing protein [Myxococcota bacterium]
MFRAMAFSCGARFVFRSSAGTSLAIAPRMIEHNLRPLPVIDGPTSCRIATRGLADAAESLGLLGELMAELSRRQGNGAGLHSPQEVPAPADTSQVLSVAEAIGSVLRRISCPPTSAWNTAEQASVYLGLPSRKALYQAVRRGLVPAHRIGRRLRFRVAELDRVLGVARTDQAIAESLPSIHRTAVSSAGTTPACRGRR